jgi:beta-mannosidase
MKSICFLLSALGVESQADGVGRIHMMKAKLIAASVSLIAVLLCCSAEIGRIAFADGGTEPTSAWSNIPKSRVYDVLPVAQRGASEISLDGQWELAEAPQLMASEAVDMEGLQWRGVQMPATIQYALFQAGAIENPWYGENWKKLQWIQDRDWYLRRQFQIPADWSKRQIRLRFDGMDYTGAVWLDGRFLGIHDGMFGGPTFNISRVAQAGREHELLVRLIHETDKSKVMKSWVMDGRSYQWVNRFRTIGLWRSIRLVSSGRAYMEAPWVRTDRASQDAASLWAQALIINVESSFRGAIQARIVDLSSGKAVWQQSASQLIPTGTSYWERAIEIQNPKLWWPNGQGGQPLYRLELSLLEGADKQDSIASRFGIRMLELRRNPYLADKPRANPELPEWLVDQTKLADKQRETLWGRPDLGLGDDIMQDDAMHNSDESSRYLFVVNGRPIYAKGACWLTSDDLLALTPQRESWLLKAARLAGINLFRLNGASTNFETEQFYNLCDEAGIMVWQELQLNWDRSSAVPLATWREQMKQSVLRLRQHPSLAVYVGGNEFEPYVEALAPYLGIGRELIAAYDNRPFRMSSPAGDDYHAYFSRASGSFDDLWIGDPNWYVRYFGEEANFISEWSLETYANLSTLKRVVPAAELARGPVGYDTGEFLQAHPAIQDRFSEPGSASLIHRKASSYGDLGKAAVAQLIEYSQMAHADVYGYVFEHWRAQFPYKGGETVWTYNPHSPSSGWNLIDWFGQPQMAYYSTKRADEPDHVMANTNFFSWGPGDRFHASVFAVNDGQEPLAGAQIAARVLDRQMKPVLSEQWKLVLPANGMKSDSHDVSWLIPADTPESYFFLELTMTAANGRRLSRRAYWLRVLKSLADPAARQKWQAAAVAEPLNTTGPWLKAQIENLRTEVLAQVVDSKVADHELLLTAVIKNTGANPAYPVVLAVDPDTYSVLWSDNYFWLAPGESVTLRGTVRLDMTGLDPITNPRIATPSNLTLSVSAWNAVASNFGVQNPH